MAQVTWFEEAAGGFHPALSTDGRDGLRRAQLGAAWALSASFTHGRGAPAMAILPTGTGKSTVLTLVPLLLRVGTPVLVAAPSRFVRDQLAEEFRTQAVLRSVGALDADVGLPTVRVVERRLADADQWRAAAQDVDVVIGTMGVLSPAYKDVADCPEGLFDLVLVDEAHHVPASTWSALLRSTSKANRALVTATPMRTDKLEIPAELVYTYKLGDALRDGVIAPIEFHAVQPLPGETRDQALARSARNRLLDPRHQEHRSLLLVRTGRIEDAKELVETYRELDLELGLVTAKTSSAGFKRVITGLENGDLHGVVSVGVLGEGFNFPRIKIAVYHRKHQSLAATLQFAGRIARRGERLGPAELLAIPGEDVAKQTRALYEAEEGWSTLLAGAADAALEEERERRLYLKQLRDLRNSNLPEPLAPAALRIARDVIVFRLAPDQASEMTLDARMLRVAGADVVLDRLSGDGLTRVLVSVRPERPDWITSDSLDTEHFEVHVAVLNREHRLLMVHSPTDATTLQLTKALGVVEPQLAGPAWLNRLLNRAKVLDYFSVGMRSARQPGSGLASYRTLAGTSAGSAVSSAEAAMYSAGHAIFRANDPFLEGTGSTSVGVSMKRSKVWSQPRSEVASFAAWCHRVARLGSGEDAGGMTLPGLTLRSPQELMEFPELPISGMLDSRLFAKGLALELPALSVAAIELDVSVSRVSPNRLVMRGTHETHLVFEAELTASGAASRTPADPGALGRFAGAPAGVPMVDLLNDMPPLIYYADGSSSQGNVHNVPPTELAPFPIEALQAIAWEGVDVRKESLPGRDGLPNVQEAMAAWYYMAAESPSSTVILNDDGSGELSDLVVIELGPQLAPLLTEGWDRLSQVDRHAVATKGDWVNVALVHCKYANSDTPRRQLKDLDEVIGQCHRSVRYLIDPARFWRTLSDRRGRRTKTIYGNDAAFALAVKALAAVTPPTTFRVQAVQPGLKISQISGWDAGERLLGACLADVGAHGAQFQMIGSTD